MNFQPQNPNFPSPNSNKKLKVSFSKGRNDIGNFNHWLGNKGKRYQSRSYSKEQIKDAYENYLCESSQESTSSQETLLRPQKLSQSKQIFTPIFLKEMLRMKS